MCGPVCGGEGYGVVSVGCGLLKTSQTLLQKFGVGDEEDKGGW